MTNAHDLFTPSTRRSRGEEIVALVVLLFMMDAFTPLIYWGAVGGETLSASNPAHLTATLVAFALPAVVVMLNPGASFRPLSGAWLLTLVLILPLASVLWSVLPEVSARRAGGYLLMGLCSLYLALRFSGEEVMVRVMRALGLAAIVSCVLCLVAPGVAVESGLVNSGAWIGVFGDKVISGAMAATGILIAGWAPVGRNPFAWTVRLIWFSACVVLLVMSQSRTAWVIAASGLALLWVSKVSVARGLSKPLRATLALAAAAVAIVVVAAGSSGLLPALGRTESLSGRTKLWDAAIQAGQADHPFWGAGYRVFWTEQGSGDVLQHIEHWARLPGNGHNGYLDTWLELGVPGALLLGVFLAACAWTLLRAQQRSPRAWWIGAALSIVWVFVVLNGSFSVAFDSTSFFWAMLLVPVLCIRAAQARTRAERGAETGYASDMRYE